MTSATAASCQQRLSLTLTARSALPSVAEIRAVLRDFGLVPKQK
jgi:hypothetical protein